jgi:plastocyanin
MFPSKLTVKAGTVVTFFMSRRTRETHTATFAGTKAYLRELVTGFNSSPIDPRASYPSSPFASGPIPLSPTSHGNGFASVGALDRDSDSSIPASGKIDFTTPGTYHFICLIHPFMHGTVVVK